MVQNEREYVATSVDGYISIENRSRLLQCAIEIKTMSSKNTVQRRLDANLSKFSTCYFDTDEFSKLVFDPSYRVQVLQHAATMNIQNVLFVVGDDSKILYCVLIYFTSIDIETYLTFLA